VRGFILVSDVVDAVLAPLAIERDAIWNLAGGEATTILELATAAPALSDRRCESGRLTNPRQ
jgi:nucleoside-diphosphate-sugar epimerase